MSEREQTLEYLVEKVGLDRVEAERRMKDDDLWLIPPDQRVALEGEGAVEQWEEAANFACALAAGFTNYPAVNEATLHLMWDLNRRADEALRRALERRGRLDEGTGTEEGS